MLAAHPCFVAFMLTVVGLNTGITLWGWKRGKLHHRLAIAQLLMILPVGGFPVSMFVVERLRSAGNPDLADTVSNATLVALGLGFILGTSLNVAHLVLWMRSRKLPPGAPPGEPGPPAG